MFCKKCGNEVAAPVKFCGKCGTKVEELAPQPMPVSAGESTVECPQCHVPCKAGAKFCGRCGHSFAAAQAPRPEPVQTAPEPIAVSEMESVLNEDTTPAPLAVAPHTANATVLLVPEDVETNGKPAEAGLTAEPAQPMKVEPAPKRSLESAVDSTSTLPSAGGTGNSKSKIIAGALAGVIAIAVGGGWWIHSRGNDEPPVRVADSGSASSVSTSQASAPAPEAKPDSTSASLPAQTSASPPSPMVASAPILAPAPVPAVQAPQRPMPTPSQPSSKVATPTVAKEHTAAQRQKPATNNAPNTTTVPQIEQHASSTSSQVTPQLKSVARTIDEQYNDRAAKDCERGFPGLLCRERLKLALCDGRWSETPPAGQELCKRIEQKRESGLL